MQGTTDVAFTVLDVLGYLDEIPVCVGYEIDGEVTTDFPTTTLLEKAKPVYEDSAGMEMRYPRYQEIRRSAGKLQKIHRIRRREDWFPDHHDFQWPGKR